MREIGVLRSGFVRSGRRATRTVFHFIRSRPPVCTSTSVSGTCRVRTAHEPGHYNRLIENKVLELGGIKSLYSDCYFDRTTFARAYAIDKYQALKQKYDPQHRTLDLYDKVRIAGLKTKTGREARFVCRRNAGQLREPPKIPSNASRLWNML